MSNMDCIWSVVKTNTYYVVGENGIHISNQSGYIYHVSSRDSEVVVGCFLVVQGVGDNYCPCRGVDGEVSTGVATLHVVGEREGTARMYVPHHTSHLLALWHFSYKYFLFKPITTQQDHFNKSYRFESCCRFEMPIILATYEYIMY